MNNLKVTSTQTIGSIQFTGIEGGFGEGTKAMLVKDIAEIHGADVRSINQAINRNRKRFLEVKDIIDLKFAITQSDTEISDYGFTQNSFNASKNIYLLSERGYAKLLKILEDDKAWEIYDQLVDNYFNMRNDLDTSNLSPELQMFNGLFKSLANQEMATKKLENRVDNISEIVSLNTTDWRKDSRNLINKIAIKQGGFGAYQEIQTLIYEEVERRAGASLKIRLTNKRRRLLDEGASKSKIDRLNKIDMISDDKRLLEIYVAIVKEFAIKYGIDVDESA